MEYLNPTSLGPAAAFVNSEIWKDFERVLRDRMPSEPEPADDPNTATAKSFKRFGADWVLRELPRIAFEANPAPAPPLIPATLTDDKD
jgi:hypothetical protein